MKTVPYYHAAQPYAHILEYKQSKQIYAHECKGLNASKQFQVWETVANTKPSVI